MWLEKRTNQLGTRYIYYEKYIDPYTNKTKRVSYTMNSCTKKSENIARQQLKLKIDKALGFRTEPRCFHEVADEWLAYIEKTTKITTYINNQRILKGIKRMIPPDYLFTAMTTVYLQNIVNEMYLERNLSFKYVQRHLGLIKAIYRYALRLNYIDDISFLERIELRKKPKTMIEVQKKRLKFLDKDELKAVLAELKVINPKIALLMEFISRTGLRFGEAVALRVEDYDVVNQEIHINGTYTSMPLAFEDKRVTPKNVYSIRTVKLDQRAKQILDWVIVQNKKAVLWGKHCKNIDGYIFISRFGKPLDLQYVNRILRKVTFGDKRLSTHVFRHTHISLLAELNVPLKAIMERVGHNDPRTTLAIYSHVTKTMQEELINKMNALSV